MNNQQTNEETAYWENIVGQCGGIETDSNTMTVDEDSTKNDQLEENFYDQKCESSEEETEEADFGDPENKGPFPSIESVTEYVHQFAKKHHFVAVIRKTDKTVNGDSFKRVFICKRGGSPPKLQSSIRKSTSSQRCGCAFKWTASTSKSNLHNWFITVKSNHHNHRVDESIYRGHSQGRKLTQEQHDMVGDMLAVSTKPSDMIIRLLDAFPSTDRFQKKSIYNSIQKHRQETLAGKTAAQHLIEIISEDGSYHFEVKMNADGHITAFFFCKKDSVALYHRFNTVLVMDATYKTNRYNMPLFEVAGMTCSNKTFFLCACFMSKEIEESYIWALKQMKRYCFTRFSPSVLVTDREKALMNAISCEIPNAVNLLCRWHIQKNVLTQINKKFISITEEDRTSILDGWNSLVANSSTEQKFNESFKAFCNSLPTSGKNEFISYIKETWIDNYKEK